MGGQRWATTTLYPRRSSSRTRESRIQSHQLHAAPCLAGRCRDLGQAQASPQDCPCCGGPAHGFHSSDRGVQSQYPAADSLCKGAVAMEAKELVQEANAVRVPTDTNLPVTIGAHSPSGVHRGLEVSLQLGGEQGRVCLYAGGRQFCHWTTFVGGTLGAPVAGGLRQIGRENQQLSATARTAPRDPYSPLGLLMIEFC
jgi:hypothetical protein